MRQVDDCSVPCTRSGIPGYAIVKCVAAILSAALIFSLAISCQAEEKGASHDQAPVVQTKTVDYEQILKKQMGGMEHAEEVLKRETSGPSLFTLMELAVAGVLLWRLFASRLGDYLISRYNPWAPTTSNEKTAAAVSLADEESFKTFAASFRTGVKTRASEPEPVAATSVASNQVKERRPLIKEEAPKPSPLESFFKNAPEEIGSLRKLFGRIGWCNDDAAKIEVFKEIQTRLQAIKESANLPEVKPAWQVAATMEGLVSRLVSKPGNLTPSCLRTAVSGLDMLTELCVPGVPADLVTEPPVQLLAVDDDAISRMAVASALKQVFSQPHLAVDGETALALASKEKYDMIFLDVEMPGMNGFELCAKIRKTSENARTPVVFITSHSDFNSRSQLPLAGGQDLIAKPFMSFEVALKALTFILRGRLAEGAKIKMPEAKAAASAEAGEKAGDLRRSTETPLREAKAGNLSWGSAAGAVG